MKNPIAYSLSATSLILGIFLGSVWNDFYSTDSKQAETAPPIPLAARQARAQQILELGCVEDQKAFIEILAAEWAEKNLDEAILFRESIMNRSEVRQRFDVAVMPIMARSRPEFVLQQVAAGVRWPDRWKQENEAFLTLAEDRPEWVADQILAGEAGFNPGPTVVREITRKLATNDPFRALEFASAMEDEEDKRFAWVGLANEWGQQDSKAASEWLSGLESGESRDAAAAAFVRGIAPTSTDEAWAWAVSIEDRELRLSAFTSVVTTENARNFADGYRNKIASSKLETAEKEALLEKLEARPKSLENKSTQKNLR